MVQIFGVRQIYLYSKLLQVSLFLNECDVRKFASKL